METGSCSSEEVHLGAEWVVYFGFCLSQQLALTTNSVSWAAPQFLAQLFFPSLGCSEATACIHGSGVSWKSRQKFLHRIWGSFLLTLYFLGFPLPFLVAVLVPKSVSQVCMLSVGMSATPRGTSGSLLPGVRPTGLQGPSGPSVLSSDGRLKNLLPRLNISPLPCDFALLANSFSIKSGLYC